MLSIFVLYGIFCLVYFVRYMWTSIFYHGMFCIGIFGLVRFIHVYFVWVYFVRVSNILAPNSYLFSVLTFISNGNAIKNRFHSFKKKWNCIDMPNEGRGTSFSCVNSRLDRFRGVQYAHLKACALVPNAS